MERGQTAYLDEPSSINARDTARINEKRWYQNEQCWNCERARAPRVNTLTLFRRLRAALEPRARVVREKANA